ncbi:HD domain-containing protein [Gammaproteobacteria bacterium]|nr:HD domain-containing protein [Gammaproteobacteria bacterium]
MNNSTISTPAKDPGCLHAWQMIPRFIGLDIRMAKRKRQLRLGTSELIKLVPEAYRIPDSKLSQQATALVREISDDMLLNHCYRTYLFGCIIAHQDGLKFDREVFYLASIMHDIGLSEKHAADPGSFEYVGAKVAHEFCLGHDYDAQKSVLVHDAIALHSAVGTAHKEDPEIALVHFGAGVDVIGIHYDEIPKYALSEILEHYPRLDFKNAFVNVVDKQAKIKPKSHIATHMKLGFGKKVKQTPFSE